MKFKKIITVSFIPAILGSSSGFVSVHSMPNKGSVVGSNTTPASKKQQIV